MASVNAGPMEGFSRFGCLHAVVAGVCTEYLMVAVRVGNGAAFPAVTDQVDALLGRSVDREFHPRRLDSALQRLPHAQWVLLSVPGRYAETSRATRCVSTATPSSMMANP